IYHTSTTATFTLSLHDALPIWPDYRYIQNLQLLKLVHIQLNSGSKVQDYAQQFHQVLDFSRNRLSLVEKMLLQNWLSQMIDLIRIEQKNESNPVKMAVFTQYHL